MDTSVLRRFCEGHARQRLLALLGVVAVVLLAYSRTLGDPFVFDGVPLVGQLRNLSWSEPGRWLRRPPRTIGYLTFDLQHSLHGLWLPGYHLVNIAIHAPSACLLGLLVEGTIARAAPAVSPLRRQLIALFAAVLFGLHPLGTHVVTYLYQRFEALMAMFFLASIWCLLRSVQSTRAAAWLAASGGCFLLSLASKEVAVVLPVVLLLFDRCYLSASWADLWRRRGWFHGLLLGVVAAGVAFVLANIKHYQHGGIFFYTRVPLQYYLGTQPEIVGHYLWTAVWPWSLCTDPAWPAQFDPLRLVAAWSILVLALAGLAWLWRWDKRLAFLPLAAGLVLVPTSSVVAVIDLAFEHRAYLANASVMVAIPLAVVLGGERRRLPRNAAADQRNLPGGRQGSLPPRLAAAVLTLLAVAFGIGTFQRTAVYATHATFWADVVTKAPHNTRGWVTLGTSLDDLGEPAAAADCYRELVDLYRGAAGLAPHPLADIARRTPRTIEYIWYGYCRLIDEALAAGNLPAAQQLYAELAAMPELPNGRLDHPRIRQARQAIAAAEAEANAAAQ